ncbi:MAG: hypothetical protein ACRYGA_00555 [Janthinobacterium lividum]
MTAAEGVGKAVTEAMEFHVRCEGKPSLLSATAMTAGFKFLAQRIDELEAQLAKQSTTTGEPR